MLSSTLYFLPLFTYLITWISQIKKLKGKFENYISFRMGPKNTLASSIPARDSVFWSDQGVYGIMSRKK
jgi:hypothetical protein